MKVITGILLAVIVALVVGFVPIVEVSHVESLDYQENAYLKREHRPTLSPEQALSPFAWSADLDEIREGLMYAYPPGGAAPDYYPIGYVSVRNTDAIRGTFDVKIVFRSGDKEYAEDFTLELKPGQSEEVKKEGDNIHYDKDKWTWQYEVIPDTKIITYKVPVFEYLRSRF